MNSHRIASLFSRAFFVFGIAIGAILISGFFRFADESVKSPSQVKLPNADGIVSLTGGSKNRLTEGIRLLENNSGKRLLISGVFKGATAEELRIVSGGSKEIYDCCVDIGRKANDTIGNAKEIEEWVKENDFKSIIIVTDSYHMPRAMLETKKRLKNVKVTAFPVRVLPYTNAKWWESDKVFKNLLNEYIKFRMAQLRLALEIEPKDTK